jgi:hypothetical protein
MLHTHSDTHTHAPFITTYLLYDIKKNDEKEYLYIKGGGYGKMVVNYIYIFKALLGIWVSFSTKSFLIL